MWFLYGTNSRSSITKYSDYYKEAMNAYSSLTSRMILQPLTGPIWENKAQTRSSDTEVSKFPTYLEREGPHVLNFISTLSATYKVYILNRNDSNQHSVADYNTIEISTYKVLGWLSSLIIWKQTNRCEKWLQICFRVIQSAHFSYKPVLKSYITPLHKHKHKR